jgi:multimeric flavodoxin WrbA
VNLTPLTADFFILLQTSRLLEQHQTGGSRMRITTLLGSPKKKGNTATVLGWVEEQLKSMGHTVDHIHLHSRSIKGCLGCAKCRENPDEIGCVQQDDTIAILKNMIASDAVLFASPLYFWGFSAQTKVLIDRTYSLVANYQSPEHSSLLQGKRMGLLVTGADDFENNAEGLFTVFDRYCDYLLVKKCAALYIDRFSSISESQKDFKKKASELAQSLVF